MAKKLRGKILKDLPDNFPLEKLSTLPVGIEYVVENQRRRLKKAESKGLAQDDDEDIVDIGLFKVNLATVKKNDIVSMRKYFPKEEYRLLKNRKSARMCRVRRKEETLEKRG